MPLANLYATIMNYGSDFALLYWLPEVHHATIIDG